MLESIDWSKVVTIGASVLSGSVSTLFTKHAIFDRPKLSLRAFHIDATQPRVVFRLVNQRKESIHISGIRGIGVTPEGDDRVFMVSVNEGLKMSMRLDGQDVRVFTAFAHDAFPHEYVRVRGFFVEDVTKPSRKWMVPRKELKRITAATSTYVKDFHDVVLWYAMCTDCGGMVCWNERTPKKRDDGTYDFWRPTATELNDLQGWTPLTFSKLPMPRAEGTCPGCLQLRGRRKSN